MQTPYWQDVLISLRQIIRSTDLHSKKQMKANGLTIPQVLVMRAISELGSVTVRRLAEQISLSQATVTTVIDRLESRGLVARERNAKDRRVVNARLTESGKEALANAPPLLQEHFTEQFERLAEWEQTQILSSLQRVARMMGGEQLDAAPLLDLTAPDRLPDSVER